MLRRSLTFVVLSTVAVSLAAAQGTVHIQPAEPHSPRPLRAETQKAVIRDYLQSWQAMQQALEKNRASLIDADFVGTAKSTLLKTIRTQAALGLRTRYLDRAHDLRIVFYSPEGLSIELTDMVHYTVQVFDHGRLLTTRQAHVRYVVVMTPSQVRWEVRVFQADPA